MLKTTVYVWVQLLQEAVAADEPVVGYDDLDEGARNLIEDFRERQWMVVSALKIANEQAMPLVAAASGGRQLNSSCSQRSLQ